MGEDSHVQLIRAGPAGSGSQDLGHQISHDTWANQGIRALMAGRLMV